MLEKRDKFTEKKAGEGHGSSQTNDRTGQQAMQQVQQIKPCPNEWSRVLIPK
jgi:hypothetical protein